MAVPLFILSILAIGFGYVAKDLWVGPGTDFLSTALFQHPNHGALIEAEFALPLGIKILPAILSVMGGALALWVYQFNAHYSIDITRSGIFSRVYRFLHVKWVFDVIVVNLVIKPALNL